MAGGGGGGNKGGVKKARIEIIPLIDIMFFLLASFMLVSLSMLKLEGLKGIKLPGAETAQDEKKPDFHTVSVTESGDVGIDKEQVRMDDLLPKLSVLVDADKRANKEPRVFMSADRAASHGLVADVLDKVRSAGVTRISFAIQKGGSTGAVTPTGSPPKKN